MTPNNPTLEREWREALAAPGTRLVKFTASWCAPCKALEPHLTRLAAQPDAPPLLRVDVEAAPELAAHYGVRAMPTLMLVRDGTAVASVVGLQSYPQLEQFLARALAAA